MGVNINFAECGGTFVDIVKENYRWSNAGEGGELSSSEVDEYGWPAVDARFLVDYRPVAEWNNDIDDPEVYRIDVSGTYACSFTGSAEVNGVMGGIVQNKAYDASSNTTTFEFVVPGPPSSGHGLLIIDFTNTRRTPDSSIGSGITGFRMYRPGYALSTDKTFTDEFIAALTGIRFSTIRFMNFTITNGCDPDYPARTVWSNRKHKEDASQNRIAPLGKTDGAAWEYVIELCNTVKMDPWINIPVSADSHYISEVATLFKTYLDPALNIYVESSNEVWNSAPGFEQTGYNKSEAETIGIEEHENHARRTVLLAELFGQVFGNDALNKRIRVILCYHKPLLKWYVVPMLDYISTEFDQPSKYLYAIASQTYFGGGVDDGESVEKIIADCKTHIDAQIDETGETNEAGRKQWIKVGADYNLVGGYCSYEGGPDHGGGSTTNVANRITAERTTQMAEVWTYNFDDAFFKLGGNCAMQFTLSSSYTRYGCWGLTEDITDPERNVKYVAAKTLAEKYPAHVISPRLQRTAKQSFDLSIVKAENRISMTYTLQQATPVTITLWNSRGQMVQRRSYNRLTAGKHITSFCGVDCTGSGYIIVTVTAGLLMEQSGIVVVH